MSCQIHHSWNCFLDTYPTQISPVNHRCTAHWRQFISVQLSVARECVSLGYTHSPTHWMSDSSHSLAGGMGCVKESKYIFIFLPMHVWLVEFGSATTGHSPVSLVLGVGAVRAVFIVNNIQSNLTYHLLAGGMGRVPTQQIHSWYGLLTFSCEDSTTFGLGLQSRYMTLFRLVYENPDIWQSKVTEHADTKVIVFRRGQL